MTLVEKHAGGRAAARARSIMPPWPARGFALIERQERSGGGDAALARAVEALRTAAFERFTELGVPTTRREEWKYTNVAAPLSQRDFVPAAGAAASAAPGELAGAIERAAGRVVPEEAEAARLVFLNGRYLPELSRSGGSSGGLAIAAIGALLAGESRAEGAGTASARRTIETHLAQHASFQERPFAALNTAFLTDGAIVDLAPETVVEGVIHVIFASAGAPEAGDGLAIYPRVLIHAGASSRVTVVETHAGLDDLPRFTSSVTEVVVENGAAVEHVKVQEEGAATIHVGAIAAAQDRDSTFTSHSHAFGGAIARTEITPVLGGEGAECHLYGLFVLGGEQLADTHTVIDHAVPSCHSNERYKGVLAERSHGVFSGKIIVRQDAQKTNAIQSNDNLLLSRDAAIDSRPQLEIFADDVRCTHGATVGQIDRNALFYLRSRGIPEELARTMLIRAFAGEVVEAIEHEGLRESLESRLIENLEKKR